MNIVIPMAGRGQRFVDAGFQVPKPLIEVRGRPMYSWAVDGLPLNQAKGLIFICLQEHLESRALETDIRQRYDRLSPRIIGLDHVTEGQACTVRESRKWIDNDQPLLIFNADTFCPTTIHHALERWGNSVEGALDVFRAPGDKWSFARLEGDRVLETAEKRRISEWVSTGLYYFRRGSDFVRLTEEMIVANDRVNGEFYVAPLYNRMIAQGGLVRANIIDEVWVLGTPEDLTSFERTYPSEVRSV